MILPVLSTSNHTYRILRSQMLRQLPLHPYFLHHINIPIVGLVHLNHPLYSNINEDNLPLEKEVSTTVVAMVGLDIVIFDAYHNPKLYSNLMEYMEVYEEYFTPHEWNDHSRLWEWLQQQCSVTKVESLSTQSTDNKQEQRVIYTVGTVTQQSSTLHINNDESTNAPNSPQHHPKQERYYFYFYPIFNTDDNDTTTTSHHHTEMIGCATICYGPIQEIIALPNCQIHNTSPLPVSYPNIQIQYMTLQQLIAYHTITETRIEV